MIINNMSTNIDNALYSRQIYTYGYDSMVSISMARVLLIGFNPLGLEISRNLILTGIGNLIIYDDTQITINDIGKYYYLSENNNNEYKKDIFLNKLKEINKYVNIEWLCDDLFECIKRTDIVIFVHDHNSNIQINEINNICRHYNKKFLYAETYGFCGRLFNDFGSEFYVINNNSEDPIELMINNITNESNAIIQTVQNAPHKLYSGTQIYLYDIDGMNEINDCVCVVVRVIDKSSFQININTINYGKFKGIGYVKECKIKQKLEFKNFSDSAIAPDIFITDYRYINKYEMLHGFLGMGTKYQISNLVNTNVNNNDILNKLILTINYHFQPIVSIIGAYACQEIVKAITGKGMPIYQWLYYDCLDLIDDTDQYNCVINELCKSNIFIIGIGAIGSELLKNLAMLMPFPIKTNNNEHSNLYGTISITDNDTIEKSNLNRQFLYRSQHIGDYKSYVAKKEIEKINPSINIKAYNLQICDHSLSTFNFNFFDRIDLIINAVDNIETRLFIDELAIIYKKPLIDCGTMGAKGNVQVVIPYMTENYGNQQDPPEESIPMCTIKDFPYHINHTIQWSKERFMDLFYNLSNNQINNVPISLDDCLNIAYDCFEIDFFIDINKLIERYPINQIDIDSVSPWSNNKKIPVPISFDINNKLHIDYMWYFVKIISEKYRINFSMDINIFMGYLMDFILRHTNRCCSIIENNLSICEDTHICPICFEKDNNDHVNLVTIMSNLRAIIYGITPANEMYTKKIAGKIIPAVITSTSIVSALAVLEGIKIINNRFTLLSNYYLNLNIPFLGFSEPGKFQTFNVGDNNYSVWDTIDIYSDYWISDLVKFIENEKQIPIFSLTFGNEILYMGIEQEISGCRSDKLVSTLTDVNKTIVINLVIDSDIDDDNQIIRIVIHL